MAAILQGLQGIFSVMLLIGVGFVLAKRGWFDDSSTALLAKLVTKLCLPLYMIANLTTGFTRTQLVGMSGGLVVPFLSIGICYLVGKLVAYLLHVPRSRRGVFCSVFFTSNCIFIGLPLSLALFGEAGVPAVMLYYIANTTTFWTIGVHDIARDGGFQAPLWSKQTLAAVFSPPLLGFVAGVLLVFLEWSLPLPLLSVCRYLGSMTTPLAMLFIGVAISQTPWAEIRFDRELLAALVGRFGVSPLCILLLVPFFPLPPLTAQVFTMQAAMPAMTNTSIVAKAYGGDYRYAAQITVVSVFIAILTTPFYMWVLQG
ncbi:MAG: AEC family transporter [Acidaminococcaceae bacterium]